jgi:glycosyltransferase involved in cell wall biosynthesis
MLTPSYFPEVKRGTERMVRELSVGLAERGERPWILTSHPGGPSTRVEEGMSVVRVPRPPAGRLRRRMLEDHLTHVPFSYAVLRAMRPDVAHAWFPTDALAAARYGRLAGRPSLLSYMGVPDHRGLVWLRGRLEITRRALAGCDEVVALSRYAAREFERWLGYEARVIYPPVDLEAFSPGGGRAAEPTIICTAVPDEARKRVPLLVAAFERVRRRHSGARLVLLRPADARLAETLARPGVELVEPVADAAALADRYRDAWVSALPSEGDSFGIVLAESLACGTPVVGTNADALPEVIDRPEIGRLFDGGEAELAEALLDAIELAQDPGTAAACRQRAEDFSRERCVDAYAALYGELLERRG